MRECTSCHHQTLGTIAIVTAREHGISIDEKALAAQSFTISDTFDQVEELATGTSFINGQVGIPFHTAAMIALDRPLGRWSDLAAHAIANHQASDGSFRSVSHRPPLEDSAFTATAWAIRALRVIGSAARVAELEDRTHRATAWLATASPRDTEDRASQLFGLVWGGAADGVVTRHARDLLAEQREDGGWAQLPTRTSDAYATGQVLVALVAAHALQPTDAPYRRAITFLLRTQAADGSWRVITRRKTPGLPHFETGFPYGDDQFISYAGTAWATTALALTLPGPRSMRALSVARRDTPARPRELVDIVIAGTVDELRAELAKHPAVDDSLRLATLAAVTRDPERLKLLLDRGVPLDTAAGDQSPLLVLAAGSRNGAANVALLLARGAAVDATSKEGSTALSRASGQGDLDSVRHLLEAGADPMHQEKDGSRPLGWAEASLDFPKLELLVTRGARPTGQDFDGRPILTLAVMDRQLSIARWLLDHGAAVDELDREGLTPLHWAATIDAGSPAFVELLLAKGANRNVKDKHGTTPRALAQRHGNRHVEPLLR